MSASRGTFRANSFFPQRPQDMAPYMNKTFDNDRRSHINVSQVIGRSRQVGDLPMQSTYADTISKNQTIAHVTVDTFNDTEQTLARQKLQKQVTNLPGFSEYRIDECLSNQLKRQAQKQMARDLMTQAQQRQDRLQSERDEELAYSRKVKNNVMEMQRKENRYARSVKNKHAKNREELIK